MHYQQFISNEGIKQPELRIRSNFAQFFFIVFTYSGFKTKCLILFNTFVCKTLFFEHVSKLDKILSSVKKIVGNKVGKNKLQFL